MDPGLVRFPPPEDRVDYAKSIKWTYVYFFVVVVVSSSTQTEDRVLMGSVSLSGQTVELRTGNLQRWHVLELVFAFQFCPRWDLAETHELADRDQ